jgi:hypothetical protein
MAVHTLSRRVGKLRADVTKLQAENAALRGEIKALRPLTHVGVWKPDRVYRKNDTVTHAGHWFTCVTDETTATPGQRDEASREWADDDATPGSLTGVRGGTARARSERRRRQGMGCCGLSLVLPGDIHWIRTSSNPAALEAVRSGAADVMGSIKPVLFELSAQLPGARVLDGRPGIDPHAMAIPKGRGDIAVTYARQFNENAKAEGRVQAAIDRAGVAAWSWHNFNDALAPSDTRQAAMLTRNLWKKSTPPR